MTRIRSGVTSGRFSSDAPNNSNTPRIIPISTTFENVTIRSGMVFWVLWAALEATWKEPSTHAMSLFNAIETLYPIACEYDRQCIRESVRPGLARLLDGCADEANIYFLQRALDVIDQVEGGR